MFDDLDHHALRALLEWQVELGATEAIGDVPVNRYELADSPPRQPAVTAPAAPKQDSQAVPSAASAQPAMPAHEVDPVQAAREAAAAAADLAALESAVQAFSFCDLKRGARSAVFADGNPAARVMIVGEAPGRDEDIEGRPFVGRAGRLLDRMFDAIDMARDATDAERALYITNISPWRPPQNRNPEPDEIAMLMPFVARHVELAAPDVLVLMGNVACQALLGRGGITRLRGTWAEVLGRPALPMYHPAYLLRTPAAKREAWADLLALRAHLKGAD
ncbi:uracil-DNA glycosylase [Alkalilacustris brevis]|uniref:uracil-DNA glycosylase n=1 Tax=Alkalilacustris brevis TaxID=2026338 RepID=UPI000E0D107C|nr:uracil-DNA glycosylase [Alkalilacustris brevis]